MRYHWGMGIGHIHAHERSTPVIPSGRQGPLEFLEEPEPTTRVPDLQDTDMEEREDPELALEDREAEGWEDVSDSEESMEDPESVDEDTTMFDAEDMVFS